MAEIGGNGVRVSGSQPVDGRVVHSKNWFVSAFAIALALMAACASTGEADILVRPHSAGAQMLPREMTSVLLERDYERVRVTETGIDWAQPAYGDDTSSMYQQKGSIIVTSSEYRMVFRSRDDPASFVRVRIKRESGFTRLTFYEEGRDGLSESTKERLQMVKGQLALRYGADRVQVK